MEICSTDDGGKNRQERPEKNFYELALKVSGAVQAMRWTPIKDWRLHLFI